MPINLKTATTRLAEPKLEFKEITLRDLRQLEILKRDFPMPDLNSPLYFVKHAIFQDEVLIGAVFTYVTSEITLILDESRSKLTRGKAINNIFSRVNAELFKMGLRDTHLFVIPEEDEAFAQYLCKHYNFVRAKGIPLYRRLDKEEG